MGDWDLPKPGQLYSLPCCGTPTSLAACRGTGPWGALPRLSNSSQSALPRHPTPPVPTLTCTRAAPFTMQLREKLGVTKEMETARKTGPADTFM